jgi:serine protease Do
MSIKSQTETVIILSATIAAIIGAVVASVTTAYLSNTFNVSRLANYKNLSNEQINSHIVELIEEESATIAVVERVAPAVVSVVVKKERGQLNPLDNSYPIFVHQFFNNKQLTDSEKKELVEVSSGTGFFVSEDGYVITNKHVITDQDANLFIVNNDGKEIEAKLIDIDPFQDIAVLKVEGGPFVSVKFADSDNIKIGQTVIAIGNTLSEFRNTVTKGVVSGINRRITAGNSFNAEVIDEAIQTDAAINPGNSGGPLINLFGEVIGINTAISSSGQDIGFSIPINQAKRAIDDVKKFGKIVRPWLGVRYVLVEPRDKENLKIQYELGAMLVAGDKPEEVAVFEGSPAGVAGLVERDVIIAINNIRLTKNKGLSKLISKYRPGDTISLMYIRNGVVNKLDLILTEYGLEKEKDYEKKN